MGLALITFVGIFALICAVALSTASRIDLTARLTAAITPHGITASWLNRLRPDRAKESIQAAVQPFDRVLPKSPQEVGVAQKRLIRAGYREDAHLRIFYGSKVLVPLGLAGLVPVIGAGAFFSPFIAYAMALGLGYLVPDFWLGRQISKRQTAIRMGLPDFLDLLVVCIEAGLSMDQAMARTAKELRPGQPEICDEMGLVILEQRAGRARVDAWRNLAERVDIEVVKSLVAAIIQADQFGTSIAKTLRIYSDGLRTRRRQDVEEKAAKTSVKLVFPLVFFIFPALFVVTLGPSLLVMADAVDKYLK